MTIKDYQDFFHDGSIFSISYKKRNLELTISSAEINKQIKTDGFVLSKDDTLKGVLHAEDVKSIKVDGKLVNNEIPMLGDKGKIFELEITENYIEISIIWINYLPRRKEVDFSTIEIEAEKIYWEPVPDLVNPFW